MAAGGDRHRAGSGEVHRRCLGGAVCRPRDHDVGTVRPVRILRPHRTRGFTAGLFHRLVRFDKKQNLGGRQMERIRGHVVGGLAWAGSLSVRALLSPHFRQTRLERSGQLARRIVEITGEKPLRTHHLQKVGRTGIL